MSSPAPRHILALLLSVVALLALSAGVVGSSNLPARLEASLLGPNMARAEIVRMSAGVRHDHRLDRGRIRSISPGAVTIAERDGLLVPVPVSLATRVFANGRPLSLAALRRGMEILTVRDGDQAAETVHVIRQKVSAELKSLPRFFLGPAMVRAEIVLKRNGVVHDYRIDRGRVRAVTRDSITLVERDGLVVPILVAPQARIELNDRPVGLPAIRKGMDVTAVRDGDGPAETVEATRR